MNDMMFITPSDPRWYDLEDLPNEEWKDIEGYEGLYQVSDYSRIKSLPRFKIKIVKILKPYKDKYNRYVVSLYNGKNRKHQFVHRLVAQTFIPNPESKPEVNHISPTTKELCDNRVCNLEWATSKENSQWTIACGNLYKPTLGKFGKDNYRSKPIIQLDTNNVFIKKWANAREINRILGIDYRFVSRCCTHKCKTVHGYVFVFEEEYNERN